MQLNESAYFLTKKLPILKTPNECHRQQIFHNLIEPILTGATVGFYHQTLNVDKSKG